MGRVCGEPGCPDLAVDGRHCFTHRRERERLKVEQRSEAGKRAQGWYKTKRWLLKRAAQIGKYPYCQCPEHDGLKLRADHPDYGGAVADHIEPHHGDSRKFWNGKLQTLTKRCHDSWKQRTERSGKREAGVPP